MKWTWPCWRLILEDKASFTEVTEKMSINDVIRLNEGLNLMHAPPKKVPDKPAVRPLTRPGVHTEYARK